MTVDANRVSLLPCPLCNCGMMLDRFVDWEGQPLANQVIIHPSPSECPLVDTQIDATPEAIAAWNRRSPSLSGGEVEIDRFTPVVTLNERGLPNGAEMAIDDLGDWVHLAAHRSAIAELQAQLVHFGQLASDHRDELENRIAAKDAEIARLTKERDAAQGWPERENITHYCTDCEMVSVLHEGRCGCGSGRVVSISSMWTQAEAAEARAKAAVEALTPFAARCDEAVRSDDSDNDGVTVKTKHLRAARAFLSTLNGAKP